MIIKKKTNLDLSNEIKGGDGNGIFKNAIVSFLQKIGLVSIRFNVESEMSVDISADEMLVLFKRQDDTFENLERDMETTLKVVDRLIEKSINMSVKAAKSAIRGINDVSEFYDLAEEDYNRKRERKEQHKKVVLNEEDQDQEKEKPMMGFHDSE